MSLRGICNISGLDKLKHVFIVDAECDGLYGEIFSIGVIVADIDTFEIVDKFSVTSEVAMSRVEQQFVKDNVIPPILKDKDMLIIPDSINQDTLLEAFWCFYMKHRESSLCIADFGAPVEARLFSECIKLDLPDREFQGPYPLHELGTILLLNHIDPDFSRDKYYEDITMKHNPYYDVLSTLGILKYLYPRTLFSVRHSKLTT